MDVKLEYYFPTPFWHVNILETLENNGITIKDLIKECKQIETKDKGRRISNYGKNAYQSHDLKNENCKDNIDKTVAVLNSITQSIYKSNWEGDLCIDNCWLNINGKGGYNIPHTHPKSILAGAFYIKVPKNSGGFSIIKNSHEHFIYNGFGNVKTNEKGDKIYDAFLAEKINFNPSVGDVFVFPAHVMHSVEINKTNKKRISLAFNCFTKWN
tara:strand:- start:60 stop:695 length:636 start_codon:yes stop_codon:yes gene_type:complete